MERSVFGRDYWIECQINKCTYSRDGNSETQDDFMTHNLNLISYTYHTHAYTIPLVLPPKHAILKDPGLAIK